MELGEIVRRAFDFYPYRFVHVLYVAGWVVGPTFIVRYVSDLPEVKSTAFVPVVTPLLHVSAGVRRIVTAAPSLDTSVDVAVKKHEDKCSARYVTECDTPRFELAYPLYRFVTHIKPTGYAIDSSRKLYLYKNKFLEAVLMGRPLCSEKEAKVVRRPRWDRVGRPPASKQEDPTPEAIQAMGFGGGAGDGDTHPHDVPGGREGGIAGLHGGPP